MKRFLYPAMLTAIFICRSTVSAQEFNLNEFINETLIKGRKTAYQNDFVFSHDFNRTREWKNEHRISENFETICSNRHCEYILTAKNGRSLSEKATTKNRTRAAKILGKNAALFENKYLSSKELPAGYGFMLMTSYSSQESNFNPNFYLKNCQVSFVEKISVESRSTVKLRASECSIKNDEDKDSLQFMPETEALVWVDEKDKAVVKMEIYLKNKLLAPTAKLVVMMKAARVSEGFWFWNLVITNATENENFFPKNYGNLQFELYNYRPYLVLIDKVEIDKK